MDYKVISYKDNKKIGGVGEVMTASSFPRFIGKDKIVEEYWLELLEKFSDYQRYLVNGDKVIAALNSTPIYVEDFDNLPNEGWDWGLEKSILDNKKGIVPNTLMGLSISINKEFLGRGLSKVALEEMKKVAKEMGYGNIIIPVRPTMKKAYPLQTMEDYIKWQDGMFDPWLRVHMKNGGELVGICHKAMTVEGTVDEWQEWTEMQFPQSGEYLIDGGLTPLNIDFANGRGIYTEANVWVRYRL